MNYAEIVQEKFKEIFNEPSIVVRSPARVNLIGEHTDYNMGYVLPGAIEKSIYFAISTRKDNVCNIFALDKNEKFKFTIDNLPFSSKGWPNYLMGVVDQLVKAHYKINGFNCVFGGDIPIGSGLSSSAAIEAGLAFALNYLYELKIDNLSIAKLSQKAENEFVGVKCGIMDQFINIFGKPNKVLLIDCRSLEYQYYPFENELSIVLFDTRVSHSLASSEYNRRREECIEGVNLIRSGYPKVTHLRDVSIGMLNEFKNKMDAIIYRRCKYVVEENDRVLKACDALIRNDLKAFGMLMYQTHDGLSKEYEVSCKELDYLVELTNEYPQIYGARMMGGGFGGCTINLIENNRVEDINKIITEQYAKKFQNKPNVYVSTISSGTSIISENENAR